MSTCAVHVLSWGKCGSLGVCKGTGKTSFRCDDAIAQWPYTVIEFDAMSHADQLAFWYGVDLPVVCLVWSGGKSIHGWIRVDCPSAEEWEQEVREKLYRTRFVPMGADPACRNPSRLTRMPGAFRAAKQAYQRLLYLAPQGKAVAS